jgi:hypothetical protein
MLSLRLPLLKSFGAPRRIEKFVVYAHSERPYSNAERREGVGPYGEGPAAAANAASKREA